MNGDENRSTAVAVFQPRDLQDIVGSTAVDLYGKMEPLFERARNVAKEIVTNSAVGALGEAADILDEMDEQLNQLTPKQYRWPLSLLAVRYRKTKRGLGRRMLRRQQISVNLEERKTNWEISRNTLKDNIGIVAELGDSAKENRLALEVSQEALGQEIEAVKAEIESLGKADEKMPDLQMALVRLQKMQADVAGFRQLQYNTEVDVRLQLAERESLFTGMATIGPQLDMLLHQQLAKLISQREVRGAINHVDSAKAGVARLAKAGAEESRDNAIDMVSAAYGATVAGETLEEVKDITIQMIDGVRAAIKEETKKNEKVVTTAKRCFEEIEAKMREPLVLTNGGDAPSSQPQITEGAQE